MIQFKMVSAIVLLSSVAVNALANNHEVFTQADSVISDKFAQHEDFSGMVSLYSMSDDNLTRHFTTGLSNQKANQGFTEHTVVDIGSLTKQFTGAAIVRLASEGKLAYLDRLGKYLPGLAPHLSDLTLHHLLTHTSGVTDETGDDYASLSLQDLIKHLNSQPLKFPIGSYHYSNLGYSLLTAVIEKVSGQHYEAYLSSAFFIPLGMHRTGYLLPAFKDKEVAIGYEKHRVWGQSHTKNWAEDGPYWNLRGNGGLLSTVADLAIWVKALHGNRVFHQDEKHALFGRYVQEYDKMLSFYGYGWVSEDVDAGRELIWHNGSNNVFTAELRYYPQDELFFVAVANKSTGPVWLITEPLHEVIATN